MMRQLSHKKQFVDCITAWKSRTGYTDGKIVECMAPYLETILTPHAFAGRFRKEDHASTYDDSEILALIRVFIPALEDPPAIAAFESMLLGTWSGRTLTFVAKLQRYFHETAFQRALRIYLSEVHDDFVWADPITNRRIHNVLVADTPSHQPARRASVRIDSSLPLEKRIGNATIPLWSHDYQPDSYDLRAIAAQAQRAIKLSDPVSAQRLIAIAEPYLEIPSIDNRIKRDLYEARGILQIKQAQFNKAKASLERARTFSTPEQVASILANLGSAEFYMAHYPLASEYYGMAYDAAQRFHQEEILAFSTTSLGAIAAETGDYSRAAQHYNESLHIANRLGDLEREGFAHLNLGFLHHYRQQWDRAVHHLETAMRLGQTLVHPELLIESMTGLGLVYLGRGQLLRAESLLNEAQQMASQMGLEWSETSVTIELGGISLQRLQWDHARHLYSEALQQSIALGHSLLAAQALYGLSLAVLGKDQFDDLGQPMLAMRLIRSTIDHDMWESLLQLGITQEDVINAHQHFARTLTHVLEQPYSKFVLTFLPFDY